MRTLSHLEMDLLLEFFEESPGYVLDFTDWTFNEFTEREIGVRVKDLYQGEGLSKHKSLCKFCKTKGNEEKAYKLFSAMMQYFDFKLRSKYEFNEDGQRLYAQCMEILRSFGPIDSGKSENSLREMTDKLRALYSDGAAFLLNSHEDKIAIGLTHLAAFIEAAIKGGEWRVFGQPLVIRVLTDLQNSGGRSIRPAETEIAENAWREFSAKLNVLLILIGKFEKLEPAAKHFRTWLSLQHGITEKVGGYSFYRGISGDVLKGLVDHFKRIATLSHPQYKENLELMYCGIFSNEWDVYDFLPADGTPVKLPQFRLGNQPTNAAFNEDGHEGSSFAKQVADEIKPLIDTLDRNRLKPILENTKDIKNRVDPFDRYRGIDGLDEKRRPLIHAAIDYCYTRQIELTPIGDEPTDGHPRLAEFGKMIWELPEFANMQAGFTGLKDFQTVLNEQAHRNERSFLWVRK